MKPRTVLVLVVLAVLSLAGGWYLDIHSRQAETSSLAAGQPAFPDLAATLASAARIEISHQGSTVTLTRHDDRWQVTQRADYPAIPARVHALLAGLAGLHLAEPRTADPSFYDKLGVEDPARPAAASSLVRVLDAAGKPLAALIVGQKRPQSQPDLPDLIYVRRPGEAQSWLAEGRLDVDADPQSWIDHDLFNIAHDRVATVTVTRGDQHLVFARKGDAMTLSEPAEHPPLEQGALEQVGRALEFVSFSDVRPRAQMPGDALATTVVTTTDGVTLTLALNTVPPPKPVPGEKRAEDAPPPSAALWINATASGSNSAEVDRLNRVLSGWAYQVGAWKESGLAPTLDDLKARPAPHGPPPGGSPGALPGQPPMPLPAARP